MQRLLISAGLVFLAIGLAWPWIGNLPGDMVIERGRLKIYLPFTTMLLVSIVLSVVLWLLRR